jgi:hypothetical protein
MLTQCISRSALDLVDGGVMQSSDVLNWQTLPETAHDARVPQSVANYVRHRGTFANSVPGAEATRSSIHFDWLFEVVE